MRILNPMARIESLLSARLFMVPNIVGDRLYFLSNLSGHLSLYVMDSKGSVPQPLLPPDIALQNPELIGGYSYYVFPKLGKILVMIDHDGDENYQPMFIPIDGGFPEPAFGAALANDRSSLIDADSERNVIYLASQSRSEAMIRAYRGDLSTLALEKLGESPWGHYVAGHSDDDTKVVLVDS